MVGMCPCSVKRDGLALYMRRRDCFRHVLFKFCSIRYRLQLIFFAWYSNEESKFFRSKIAMYKQIRFDKFAQALHCTRPTVVTAVGKI